MLRPSYTELMDIANQDAETDNKITSRYSIVIAAAKRARQIIDGAAYDASGVHTDKAVSIAINEMQSGKIKIFPEGLENNDFMKFAQLKPRAVNRAGQGVGISADAVISSKDYVGGDIMDYGDDMDDELFEDEAIGTDAKKDYGFRAGGFEEDGEYGGASAGDYDDYDYEEDSLEMEIENDDFNYGGGEPN